MRILDSMTLEFDNLSTAVWIYDIDQYQMVWANKAALDLWEYESLAAFRAQNFESQTPDAVQENLLAYRRIFAEGRCLTFNWSFAPQGVAKQAYCQLSGHILDDGRMGMLVEALPSESLHSNTEVSPSAVLSSFHYDGRFISGNPAFRNEVSNNVIKLASIIRDTRTLRDIYDNLRSSGRYEGDVLVYTVNGECWYRLIATEVRDDRGNHKILLHQYDIHQRKSRELSLIEEAYTDPLTGLLNRRGLSRNLNDLVARQQAFVLYYIDLDGFKLINDSFGHAVGDQVLQSVAKRLSDFSLDKNIVCRFGGDEFILALACDEQPSPTEALANHLIKEISGTYYDHNDSPLNISCSVGIARYPHDTEDTSDLIAFADAAMYHSKHLGKHRWTTYHQNMEQGMRRQSKIAQRLYNAEQNGELALHYQPIWDVEKQRIMSFEALLRWTNPELGLVPAEEAIQVAEEVGIIYDIENWVIQNALADLVILRKCVSADVTMAVNISGLHFSEPSLPDYILTVLKNYNLSPGDVVVELTESTLLDNIENEHNPARRFVDKGMKISIDDFGTGFSSLAYLHEIPAATVKIDRSFIQRIENSGETLLHIHRLIKSLNIQTLAEGVETEQQRDLLKSFGINLHQGYLHGRPQALSDYVAGHKRLFSA